ncbi:MAG: hypothetical protein RBU37_18970 [Myxococcota bacterium]|jgi:hypothetical protein|nr:hypothetical protein [Myxococcota bacterium]
MKAFDELLRQAGLSASLDSEEASLELPRHEGAPQGDASGELSLAALEPLLGELNHRLLQKADFSIEAVLYRSAELVVVPPLGSYRFIASHDAVTPQLLDDGRSHRLSLREGEAALYAFERGQVLRLGLEQGRLKLQHDPAAGQALAPAPQPTRAADRSAAEALLEQLAADDAWLAQLIAEDLRSADFYRNAVGYGALHRLYIPNAKAARIAVERVLRGESAQRNEPAIDWLRACSPSEQHQLEREAMAALDYVVSELRSLRREKRSEQAAIVEDPSWRRRLLLCLHERDALEGVCTLLAAAGRQQPLRDALSAFDEDAEFIMDELLPVPELTQDLRLERARLDAPDAWWTRTD